MVLYDRRCRQLSDINTFYLTEIQFSAYFSKLHNKESREQRLSVPGFRRMAKA